MGLILVGLDRDGTINHDPGHFGKQDNWKEILKIYDGVIEGIKLLNKNQDIKVIVATNQGGVARGYYNTKRVKEINKTINDLLSKQGAIIHNWQYCPYFDEITAEKKKYPLSEFILKNNDIRVRLMKPNIGMLEQAAKEMGYSLIDFEKIYFLGDKVEDVLLGLNAGGKGIMVKKGAYPEEIERFKQLINPGAISTETFLEAVNYVINDISI
ncbi:MAG: HAD-IIIA family hydrolase [Candidatus Pacearchaeota archaeon]|jgi:D-glycero-D-manno-heptose 1,7-bisphosphate phosphatase